MKVALFGATGMVGLGVLRECLRDHQISQLVVIGRTPTGESHPKLIEHHVDDLSRIAELGDKLDGFDACLFPLGVSAAGIDEALYFQVTHDLTLTIARDLLARNPAMVFVYVSGAGTDSSEQGRSRWARVKGRTENTLLALPFKAAYMLRPGMIQPLHGIQSKTRSYRLFYRLFGPLLALIRVITPSAITTTEQMGRAMITLADGRMPSGVLSTADINRL